MASASLPAAGVTRVQHVYTPPERRGAGYATACVEHMSRELADRGLRCVLYTDLRNPTSNAIYRRIGYEAVAEVLATTSADSAGRRCPRIRRRSAVGAAAFRAVGAGVALAGRWRFAGGGGGEPALRRADRPEGCPQPGTPRAFRTAPPGRADDQASPRRRRTARRRARRSRTTPAPSATRRRSTGRPRPSSGSRW